MISVRAFSPIIPAIPHILITSLLSGYSMHDLDKVVQANCGDATMKNSKEILSSILKTTQMGQIGIRSVLDTRMQPSLRSALHDQLREYDAIETEAHTIAGQRGWELPELDPAVRFMADRITRFRLTGKNTDSRVADMMILGNTRGMIKSLKNLHQFTSDDQRVRILSQKLLDCENANIRQMQDFL